MEEELEVEERLQQVRQEFATGFQGRGRRGRVEGSTFTLVLGAAMVGNRPYACLQTHYDWLMGVVVEAGRGATTATLPALVEAEVGRWLATYQGWGLLQATTEEWRRRAVLVALAATMEGWDPANQGTLTRAGVFEVVRRAARPRLGVRCLVPEVEASLRDCPGSRYKVLTLLLHSSSPVTITFFIKRRERSGSLVELAAAALSSSVGEERVGTLGLASHLEEVVREQLRDREWTRQASWVAREAREVINSFKRLKVFLFGEYARSGVLE